MQQPIGTLASACADPGTGAGLTDRLCGARSQPSPMSLSAIPAPSLALFGYEHPWMPISSAKLAERLALDRGLLGTWRLRGIGPQSIPTDWLKGRANAYRISVVLAWLASRRGESRPEIEFWQDCLDDLGIHAPSEHEVRNAVMQFAQATGPRQSGLKWSGDGWRRYVASLVDVEWAARSRA